MNQSWNHCCNLLVVEKEATTDEIILKVEKELEAARMSFLTKRLQNFLTI